MAIRILLADDHAAMREGLRALLENEDDFEVVATAGDGRESVRLTEETRPDVVIMDITMPRMTGIEATRWIKEHSPRVKVLALSVHTDVDLVREMIHSGALGYVPKSSPPKEIIEAVRTVSEGRPYISAKVAGALKEHRQSRTSTEDCLPNQI